MAFELPQLDYAYDALEPHIDARTMEIHHSKPLPSQHDTLKMLLNQREQSLEKEKKSNEIIELKGEVKRMKNSENNNNSAFEQTSHVTSLAFNF